MAETVGCAARETDKRPCVCGCGPRPRQSRVDLFGGHRADRARAPEGLGGLSWAGFFLYTQAGALVDGYFRSYERQRLSRPGPPSPGRAGSSRSPGTRDRALTWGAGGGGRREPGPGFRGTPRPLPGLHGLRARPALGLQQRLDTEGQRPGPRTVPVVRPKPSQVHAERSGAMRWPGGAGLAEPGGATWRQRDARLPGAPRRPLPRFPFYKKQRPFQTQLSIAAVAATWVQTPLDFADPEGGHGQGGAGPPAKPRTAPRAPRRFPGAAVAGLGCGWGTGEHEELAPASSRGGAHSGRDGLEPRSGRLPQCPHPPAAHPAALQPGAGTIRAGLPWSRH